MVPRNLTCFNFWRKPQAAASLSWNMSRVCNELSYSCFTASTDLSKLSQRELHLFFNLLAITSVALSVTLLALFKSTWTFRKAASLVGEFSSHCLSWHRVFSMNFIYFSSETVSTQARASLWHLQCMFINLGFHSFSLTATPLSLLSMMLVPSVAKPLTCETGRSLFFSNLRTVSPIASALHESNSSNRFRIAKNFTSGHPDEFRYWIKQSGWDKVAMSVA